jgi:hypothetical protein
VIETILIICETNLSLTLFYLLSQKMAAAKGGQGDASGSDEVDAALFRPRKQRMPDGTLYSAKRVGVSWLVRPNRAPQRKQEGAATNKPPDGLDLKRTAQRRAFLASSRAAVLVVLRLVFTLLPSLV